ncbi:hypothetical protein VB738_09075 [Cyanobium gracile UHCC 0139]|uniref:Uncharacterized protein n=1 Tax=Cyanobium gracile UHCC 0139 TaxID=3110308 RepID=A0ABU5RUH2_9CYAN|nr:hypothetical protein [Cyanobium gracile]MEA5391411.1 hypothetical protein [Cyanobium gracile UHCC 0139]
MISRSSRLLHAALAVVCGAGIVYAPVQAQTSLTVPLGQPGYYGRITIGNLAPPPVLSYRPVIARPSRGSDRWTPSARVPIYLRVPPQQARDWGRYCRLYQACGVPVLFVQDDWYRNTYAPRVRAAQARQAREARDRWRASREQGKRLVTPDGRVFLLEKRRDRDDD